uniref:Fas apoptotic inhibitory molecule 1 n=3 Tax=Cyprinus carpio TaxID=7962 RepID=A0A9J8BZP2_CYPCA
MLLSKLLHPRAQPAEITATPSRNFTNSSEYDDPQCRRRSSASREFCVIGTRRQKMSGDLVAVWDVALSDGVHRIEFEHGTTTGKRIIYIDGKEVIKRDWMFKLVGKETFHVGGTNTKATINIDAVSGFAYEYTLEINGQSLKKYMENRSKVTSTWLLNLDGIDCRVVLEKDTMDIWCNGQKMETAGEFVDDGTETHFTLGDHDCCIKAMSSGKRRDGIIHMLLLDGMEISESE